MLDSFRLSHQQVSIRDSQRRYVQEFTFTAAGNLAASALDPPDRALLGITHSVGDNMSFYGLWVRQHLRKVRARNKASGNTPLAHLDEKLLRVILLHKLMQRLNPRENAQMRIAHHAVGAMIQKDLTLLLAEVRLQQWNRIFNLRKLKGVDSAEWEKHIAGASAATFVLMTLDSRVGAEVFLASGHEDVNLGIDLLWVERGVLHAVSIKCITGQDAPVRAWRVTESPVNGNGDPLITDKQSIFQGAQRFASSEGRSCAPVLIYVAKPEGAPIQLSRDWERLTWPDRLLEQRQQPANKGRYDLAR